MNHIATAFVPLLRLSYGKVKYEESLVDLFAIDVGWRLTVHSCFANGRWHSVRSYLVGRRSADMNGLAFVVHYVSGSGELDGETQDRHYNCFVAADQSPDFCDCVGSLSRDYCVHRSVLRWAVECGYITASQEAISGNFDI